MLPHLLTHVTEVSQCFWLQKELCNGHNDMQALPALQFCHLWGIYQCLCHRNKKPNLILYFLGVEMRTILVKVYCYHAVQQDRQPKLKTLIHVTPNLDLTGQEAKWQVSFRPSSFTKAFTTCLVRFAKAEYKLQWLSLYEQRKGLHGFQIKQQSSLL